MKYNVVVTLEVWDVEAESTDDAVNLVYSLVDNHLSDYEGAFELTDLKAFEAE